MYIPFVSFRQAQQDLHEACLSKLRTVVESELLVLGSTLKAFETDFAQYTGTSFATGVGNGLDALTIALLALDIKCGDEVIVPSNTCIATWLAVSATGATPIPVEPDEQTFNINPSLIQQAITKKTKAILPVHLYGLLCDMESILSIAQAHGLYVVEDFAQSHGAVRNGKMAGSYGHINGTSFYPTKNLGAWGDGGAITTNNLKLYEQTVALRNYGSIQKYHHEFKAGNSRLDTIQAAILQIKLTLLEKYNGMRIKAASLYFEALKNIPEIQTPELHNDGSHVYHLYVVRTNQRNELQEYLGKNNIETSIHYPIPTHLQKAYRHDFSETQTLAIAEKLAESCLSLPMFPGITEDEIDYVSEKIRNYFNR